MIDLDAALGQEFLQVAVRQAVAEYQRTASKITSGGNRNPVKPEGSGMIGRGQRARFIEPSSRPKRDPSTQQSRFDSPAVFARLLGEDAGHWSIRPADAASCTRRYVDRTLVLETTYRTETGVVTLTDALAVGAQDQGHQLGAGTPAALLRHVACVEGSVDVDVMYAGRFAIAP